MRIKILVDHVSREMNFAGKIKKIIESSGIGFVDISHQDYINTVNHYDFIEETYGKQYDILIVPSYNVARMPETLLRAVCSKSKLIIYHSEQMYNDQYNTEKLNLDCLNRYNKHVAAHFVWGEEFGKKLIDLANIQEEDVFIVGNYKFDFISKHKDALKLQGKKTVLLASDFKLADYNDKEFASFQRMYKVNLPESLHDTYREGKVAALEWIKRFAIKYSHIDFILRPHPGEDRSLYEQLAGENLNIQLSLPNISYADDLSKADLVLSFTSTSVLEVIAANKFMISMKVAHLDTSFLSQHREFLIWYDFDEIDNILVKMTEGKEFSTPVELRKKFNRYIKQYPDVCVNVVEACQIINKSNKHTTKLLMQDYYFILLSGLKGIFKQVLVSQSFKLKKIFPFSRIHAYSVRSYEKRLSDGELIDNGIIDNAVRSAEQVNLEEKKIKTTLTKSGWVFL